MGNESKYNEMVVLIKSGDYAGHSDFKKNLNQIFAEPKIYLSPLTHEFIDYLDGPSLPVNNINQARRVAVKHDASKQLY